VIYSSSVNINVDTPSLDPVAGLTVSNLPISATTVLACTVATSDPENKISKIVVDFGDGSAPVTGRSAIRTYASPGTYAVKATAYDATGRTNSVTRTISVGGACAAPADNRKINLCSPLPGSVVASPVAFRATGGTDITWMEAWVDGVKRYSQSGRTMDLGLALSGGSHTVSVYGKTNGAVVDKGTATFTVQ
jgi:PKD repeat protein